jgi:DNA repair exonuclease SbcCD ATPase subunit
LQAEQAPYLKAIALLSDELNDISQQLSNSLEAQKKFQDDLRYVEFWVTGFGKKGLQSYLLDTALPYLTQKANEYAGILCGGEIEIAFESTALTKTGSVREDFTVRCVNKNGAVVYKGQSGGEQNKIDICVALALQDLMLARLGTDLNFGVFDESVTYIDAEGAHRVLQLLDKLSQTRETIFFVTHNPVYDSCIPTHLQIVKEGGISRQED